MIYANCENNLNLSQIRFFANGREDRIRTCDILLPKQALHQAELLPV